MLESLQCDTLFPISISTKVINLSIRNPLQHCVTMAAKAPETPEASPEDAAKARWKEICIDIDLSDERELIEEMKGKPISVVDKFNMLEEYGPDSDETFECYLWTIRKLATLKYIAICSTSHEERMKECDFIFSSIGRDEAPIIGETNDTEFIDAYNESLKKEDEGDDENDEGDEGDEGNEDDKIEGDGKKDNHHLD
jgi:hypothetical protein